MSRTLSECAAPFYVAQNEGSLSDPNEIVRGSALISYWLASLETLREGWEELKLSDAAVDAQLTPEHLQLLKQYRHTVFHFQASLVQARIVAFERNHAAVGWAIELGTAFEEFFDPHLDAIQVERIRSWLFAD
ncbi:MAG: hypothetical protein JNL44_15535 [Gemmatimonadetes bacterium]|nr:hypothetical protein [Gemmatimonadota bacterium]